MVLDSSRPSQPSAPAPNSLVQEPNIPVEILAEGVITIDAAAPVVSVMTAATETPEFKYRLTYRQSELTDGDFWGLYQQYLAVDPNHPERQPDAAFLREQLSLAPGEMNLEKLSAHFEACGEKLALLEQAVRCRTVVWPKIRVPRSSSRSNRSRGWSFDFVEPEIPEHLILKIADVPTLLKQLDTAGLLLSAKARFHIAKGEYAAACQWVRAALAQGRQMTQDADALPAMTGAVNVGRALGQVEAWVRQPQSPSLFRSLGDLPRPLIRLSGAAEESRYSERTWETPYDILEVEPGIIKQSPRVVQNIERLIAALQCVEAVRLHAALNEGRIPEALAEITDVRVPLDPVTRLPFIYMRQEGVFTLSSETDDGDKRLEIRYRIIREPQPEFPGMSGMFGMPVFNR